MSQITTGWRFILSIPCIYQLSQNLLSGPNSRNEFIEKYIRPKPGIRILDLGCGPAQILNLLPRDIHYVGIDSSPLYIEVAKKKYGNRGEFHCLPVQNLAEKGFSEFDLVMGLSVIHHLDNEQADCFFDIAAKALNEKGRCITIDPCLVQGQHVIAQVLIRMDRGQNIRSAEEYSALARKRFSYVKQNIHHDRLRIPYTHCIMECWK